MGREGGASEISLSEEWKRYVSDRGFRACLSLAALSSLCRLRPRFNFCTFAVERGRGGVGSYMQGTGAMHPACLEVS